MTSGSHGNQARRPVRVTSGDYIHHHFYFTNLSWSPDGSRLYVVRYVDDLPNICAVDAGAPGYPIRQLTHRRDINPYSPAACPTGKYIYFTAGRAFYQLDLESGAERELARFSDGFPSNMAVSADGEWVATSVRGRGRHRLVAYDVKGGRLATVVEAERSIGHVQFSLTKPYQILYSGPPEKRIWLVGLDGTGDRLLYEQTPEEWVVHESWLGPTGWVIFTRWPDDLSAVHVRTGEVRRLVQANAWHACADRSGKKIVFDTAHPDTGLHLLDPETGRTTALCLSQSSNLGSQWRFRYPAPGASADPSIFRDVDEGMEPPPVDRSESAYGPQWTHPHPAFSPGGDRVVYTSDAEGSPHVYVVQLAD